MRPGNGAGLFWKERDILKVRVRKKKREMKQINKVLRACMDVESRNLVV